MQPKPPAPGRKRSGKKQKTLPRAGKPAAAIARDYTRHLLAGLALCALTLLAYSNSFHSGFVLDNQGLLLDPRIRDATPENLALILRRTYWWPTGEAGLYRPFTTLSYLFNYAVLGDRDQPAGYHTINLLLHLGNVLLVYGLANRLVRKFWPSVFIAAVWAVHPVLTESVTNIVGRADLLAAMAVLAGFLMYLRSAGAGTTPARMAWLAGLAVVTAIGVFSKESAVAILPLIVFYEIVWWKERPQHRALMWGCIATLLPIAVMLYQRSVVLATSPAAEFPVTDNPIAGADWWTGRLTAVKVMARYLWLAVWPAKLSCDYSYNQIPVFRGAAGDWLACGAVLAIAILGVLLYRWNRTCFFLAGFAFLNFVPASNLAFPIGTIMADRLLYLPSLGLIACAVLAIYQSVRIAPAIIMIPPVALCLLAAGFATRTWLRNADWQTELTLATADVSVSPNSFKLHRLLASALFASDPAHANIDRVIEEQEKSLAILDTLPSVQSGPDPYRQAGYYYLLKGDRSRAHGTDQGKLLYAKALRILLRSISIDDARRAGLSSGNSGGDPEAYLLLSLVYSRLGDANHAYEAINRARALDPLNPQMYRQLATVFALEGREEDADIASLLDHAITSLHEGKWRDTAELSGRVLQLRPADYGAAYILNAMANLRLGNLDRAETSAREAIRFDGGHPTPRNNYVLGMILAQKRDFKASAELLHAYLTAAPNAPDAETVRRQLSEIEQMAHNQLLGR